jgi:hypothetical protein
MIVVGTDNAETVGFATFAMLAGALAGRWGYRNDHRHQKSNRAGMVCLEALDAHFKQAVQ